MFEKLENRFVGSFSWLSAGWLAGWCVYMQDYWIDFNRSWWENKECAMKNPLKSGADPGTGADSEFVALKLTLLN